MINLTVTSSATIPYGCPVGMVNSNKDKKNRRQKNIDCTGRLLLHFVSGESSWRFRALDLDSKNPNAILCYANFTFKLQ